MMDEKYSPKIHLIGAHYHYPDIWRRVDLARTNKSWPDWCFIPISELFDIVEGDWKDDPKRLSSLHLMATDVARLAALTAWRTTKCIYVFNEELYKSVITTPINELPCEVLRHLPEWCVYIELKHERIKGFFAHLEYDKRSGQTELRLLIDYGNNLIPCGFPLINGTLLNAIGSIMPKEPFNNASKDIVALLEPMIAMLLYLCSVNADLGKYTPHKPKPVNTKKGTRFFEPNRETIVQVGDRMGASLKASGFNESITGKSQGKYTVAPHIRRAHWHGYWVGSGDEKRFDIRWMPPIIVHPDKERGTTTRAVQ